MVAADWVSVECDKDNIVNRLRYHLEADKFYAIFKDFLHIKDAIFKGKLSQMSCLAVDRLKFFKI